MICSQESVQVSVSPSALKKVTEANTFLNKKVKGEVIYGINTGFGPMADHVLGNEQLFQLQKNLINSHAVGMGSSIPNDYVLSAMVVRLNTLTRGFSGVSSALLKRLELLINKRIIPVIPAHGAVGTSGDLVQLAHIALAIIGSGQVWYNGIIYETAELYKKLRIQPYILQPKEGLSLINGTSVMAGISSLLTVDANRLINLSTLLGALSLELVNAYTDSLSPLLHSVRPHAGQQHIAKSLRKILANSKLLKTRAAAHKNLTVTDTIQELPESIQEVYSLRCIPQILGPIFDTYLSTRKVLETEINSTTDNPIVDVQGKNFLHGGNFHGDYVAMSIDYLKISLVKLTMLSERRINFFLHNRINKRFPPFMNLQQPGLTLGLQGLQFVATSTTAHSQSMAFPHHIHSIPTNGDNQDVVSMGTDASLIAAMVIENSYIVQSIELLTLAQGVDFLNIENKLSSQTRELYRAIREIFPKLTGDRVQNNDLAKVLELLKNTLLLHF